LVFLLLRKGKGTKVKRGEKRKGKEAKEKKGEGKGKSSRPPIYIFGYATHNL